METIVTNKDLERFDGNTPTIQKFEGFEDADDELIPIAEYVKQTTVHNADIEPKRIKFLYSDKPSKCGERYAAVELFQRKPMEKMVNNDFDFIVTVFYDVWKELKGDQKVIQIDKALCGIDMGSEESGKLKKRQPDSKEYTQNMNHFTPRKVMEVSEMVHLTCQRIMEEKKEAKKNNG